MKNFSLNGISIACPTVFKPVFSTTSTDDSDRDQGLTMHNTPIGTIAGYDLTWDYLTFSEARTILNGMMNRSKFSFYHPDPTLAAWVTKDFYATDYSMEAVYLEDKQEYWKGLNISIRRIDAIK